MQGVPPPSAHSVPKGRGRRVSAPGSEEQQAALLAAALSVQFSDSDLSFSDDSDSGEGDAADKSKSTSNSSTGAQVGFLGVFLTIVNYPCLPLSLACCPGSDRR